MTQSLIPLAQREALSAISNSEPTQMYSGARFMRVSDEEDNLVKNLANFKGLFVIAYDDNRGIFEGTLKLYFMDSTRVPEGTLLLATRYTKSNSVWLPKKTQKESLSCRTSSHSQPHLLTPKACSDCQDSNR